MKSAYALLVAFCLAFLLTVSNVLLKRISASNQQSVIEMYSHSFGKLVVALGIYFAVFLIYPYVLRYFPVSIVFPVYTGLAILMVMLAGVVFFGEKIQLLQCLGAAFLIIGIAFIAFAGDTDS